MMKGVAGGGALPAQMGGMSAKLARAAAKRLPAGDLPPALAGLAGPQGTAPPGLASTSGRAQPARPGSKKKKGGRVTPPKHR